ncbi:MAG: DUF1549 and DUF1553 domain-containing protein [Planctomycetota bacterium]|nr:DUF1549 and DUF1553 domain-containing protein [Planctomycetota bacterium]
MIRLAQLLLAAALTTGMAIAQSGLTAYPAKVTLDSGLDAHRLVIVKSDDQGITVDVTASAQVSFASPNVAEWRGGKLLPLGDGETVATVRHDGLRATVAIAVTGAASRPPVSFRNDVIPVLTRAGCNGGACHGAAAGKNGFGLTLFGYDPAKDLRALSRDYRGRRLDCAAPEQSLMLTKPTGEVRHKGGKRFERDGEMWETLRAWIAAGAADDGEAAPTLVALQVEPRELVLAGPGQRSDLVVTAAYSDGSVRDVTKLSLLSSSNPTSAEIKDGAVISSARGEAFLMARFGYLTEVAQVIVLPDDKPWAAPAMDQRNEIDLLVQQKLVKLRLRPAPRCDDATYLRRVYVDVIGQLPTPDEVRAFLADEREGKRAAVVDALLARPEFPDVWAMTWAEVLRIEPQNLEQKGVHLFTRWLRESLRDGAPMDQVVRSMLTAKGSAFRVPEANYWVTSGDPKVLAENAAQTFLGIRLQCAQCHNHPFERWRMDDYYGFAAFFTQVGRKNGDTPRESIVYDRSSGEIRNARTQQNAAPRFLGGDAPKIAGDVDRREVLADWLTSPRNPWFARNIANRVWARFFGRGLVHPVDDVRVSNPPSHPALHRRLGEKLAASGFDVRALIREICASSTYQAAQHPDTPPAATFAGATPRRLSAEQLLDAIGQVTGVPTKFRGVPLGQSAVQVVNPDGGNRFLDLFGRPDRDSVCTCERREEPTLNQVLHLINGATIEAKVRSAESRLARLLTAKTSSDDVLDELFLAAYGRPPRANERERVLTSVAEAGDDARAAWEDVLWAIFNSAEFLFQH